MGCKVIENPQKEFIEKLMKRSWIGQTLGIDRPRGSNDLALTDICPPSLPFRSFLRGFPHFRFKFSNKKQVSVPESQQMPCRHLCIGLCWVTGTFLNPSPLWSGECLDMGMNHIESWGRADPQTKSEAIAEKWGRRMSWCGRQQISTIMSVEFCFYYINWYVWCCLFFNLQKFPFQPNKHEDLK